MLTPTLTLLREETAGAHRELDGLSPLGEAAFSTSAYVHHLRAMWAITSIVEGTFYRSAEWRRAMPDHALRFRSELIRRDLEALGRGAAAPPSVRFAVNGFAEGMGAAYVLEGSTLGGKVLARRVRDVLGPSIPAEFLESYGANVGSMWKEFCRVLEASTNDESRARVCQGARDAFAAVKRSFLDVGAGAGD